LRLTQARSQEWFEGVRPNPPCSLATFIFNKTAAVQGTIIQLHVQWYCYGQHTSHHAAAARGSHIYVTCRSVCDHASKNSGYGPEPVSDCENQ